MSEAQMKVTFHLGSGATISALVETSADAEPSEVAEELLDPLTARRGGAWLQIENVLVFTGAVSAIEIDTA